jgi:site-specific DNA recombinase
MVWLADRFWRCCRQTQRLPGHSLNPDACEWRAEQDRLLRDVETHQSANQTYVEEGVQLLHLAQHAHELFERQAAAEKRRLLSFLLSNCVWKGGLPTAEYRQPFHMLALAREVGRTGWPNG